MAKRRSRSILTLAAAAGVAAIVVFAFWPRPSLVDLGEVTRGAMMVTIDEEGRTSVHDAYVVSTPIAGRLLRVDVDPGVHVVKGESVVARMLPTNPAALDIRTREQALAAVNAARAALRVARADYNTAQADKELAFSNLERFRELRKTNTVSQAALDRAVREGRAAEATLVSAEAAISMREAEVENAQARLISFDDHGLANAIGGNGQQEIALYSPATGRVLRVIQQSETTLPAGAPVMEIGNVESDLEVIVELLSTDAVQVTVGDKVLIDDWGGPQTLDGIVERIDPWGFKKVSALGVEEQRVNTVVRFTGDTTQRSALGHGFRVEARIVVWQTDDTLKVPASALFRNGADWSVFAVEGGRAVRRSVKIGRNNGIEAQVLEGLGDGDAVILYPSSALGDGGRVAQRQLN